MTEDEAKGKAELTILADASDSHVTVELPAASSNAGSVHVKKIDASANAVTVVCNATQTFDATEGHAIAAPWDAIPMQGLGGETVESTAWCPDDRCARCGATYLPAGNCSRWEEGCQGGRGDGQKTPVDSPPPAT